MAIRCALRQPQDNAAAGAIRGAIGRAIGRWAHGALLPRSGRGYQPIIGRLKASSIAATQRSPLPPPSNSPGPPRAAAGTVHPAGRRPRRAVGVRAQRALPRRVGRRRRRPTPHLDNGQRQSRCRTRPERRHLTPAVSPPWAAQSRTGRATPRLCRLHAVRGEAVSASALHRPAAQQQSGPHQQQDRHEVEDHTDRQPARRTAHHRAVPDVQALKRPNHTKPQEKEP